MNLSKNYEYFLNSVQKRKRYKQLKYKIVKYNYLSSND